LTKFSLNKKTLFVGAHPDDIPISAGIFILNNSPNCCVVTLTDGAPLFEVDYPVIGDDGSVYNSPDDYATKRLNEDLQAFDFLGVKDYVNFKYPDQEAIKHVEFIISKLEHLVRNWNIRQIVTHEFPQTHPDHEVAWFVSHFIGLKYNLDVWEFPGYKYVDGRCITEFSDISKYTNLYSYKLSKEEISKKTNLLNIYSSQEGIIKNHLVLVEEFAQQKFGVYRFKEQMPYLSPWIRKAKPELLRLKFKELLGDIFE